MKTAKTFDFSKMSISFNDVDSRKYRKEKGFYKSRVLVGLVDGQIIDLAQINYYSTGTTCYACLWLSNPILGLYGVVGGKAGGYGYNKEQAVFEECLNKLNVKVTGDFDDGSCLFDDASFFVKLAGYLGVNVFKIVNTHA